MLTGDRAASAQIIANEVGLTDYKHSLHPEDKVAIIQEWRKQGDIVAMAGDGVNDAPSLAAADVSIGMGLRGSDAVLEQADVVLTYDKLESLLDAYHLSRRCHSIIRQNLAISLGVVLLLGLAAIGSWIPLTMGVLGHEGSTIIVVMNSMRILFFVSAGSQMTPNKASLPIMGRASLKYPHAFYPGHAVLARLTQGAIVRAFR